MPFYGVDNLYHGLFLEFLCTRLLVKVILCRLDEIFKRSVNTKSDSQFNLPSDQTLMLHSPLTKATRNK